MVAKPLRVLLLALPETAGSALYGMLDVLAATGNVWQTLLRQPPLPTVFDVRVLGLRSRPFRCGHGVPVRPAVAIGDDPAAELVIVPELWLGPDEDLQGRYPAVEAYLRRRHEAGSHLYSACSGAVMLAASGLLNGRQATSHWGYQDLFRSRYPEVEFRPEPTLCFADADGRIVTAGGTTSWHDLAIHIIARHASPGEALRMTKVYLLKWHGDGQLPYAPLVRPLPHADARVRDAEAWLEAHFRQPDPVKHLLEALGIPPRTLKRRFKAATGQTLIERVQDLRTEAAKRLLESGRRSVDDISAEVGYDDAAFFRRLFKRRTGLTPRDYRRMFQPLPQVRRPALNPGHPMD